MLEVEIKKLKNENILEIHFRKWIHLGKAYQKNPLIEYIHLISLRGKISSLREVFSKASIDVLYVDETKLDASFPGHQNIRVGIPTN